MQKCTNVVENPLSLSPFINLLFACITHSIFETSCVLVVLITRKKIVVYGVGNRKCETKYH